MVERFVNQVDLEWNSEGVTDGQCFTAVLILFDECCKDVSLWTCIFTSLKEIFLNALGDDLPSESMKLSQTANLNMITAVVLS